MKKFLIPVFIVVVIVVLGIFWGGKYLKIGQPEKFSALQITSVPSASVLLDDKKVGKTPYYDDKLKSGEYTIKLAPPENAGSFSSWTGKIKLTPETMTVINWQLGKDDTAAEGEILSLEPAVDKATELAVLTSSPDSAEVRVDSQIKGQTPLILKDITPGDHEIILTKEGYNQRIVPAKAVVNYRLTINAQLSQAEVASPSAAPVPEATASAQLSKNTAVIKETETGFLRVRFEPTLNATEAARVKPGDEFPLIDEKDGWTEIEYEKGKNGWVSSQYVEKK